LRSARILIGVLTLPRANSFFHTVERMARGEQVFDTEPLDRLLRPDLLQSRDRKTNAA
jgi:hypothetical protein